MTKFILQQTLAYKLSKGANFFTIHYYLLPYKKGPPEKAALGLTFFVELWVLK